MNGTLIPAAWDIMSALDNSQGMAEKIGGSFLGLIGLISIITAVVFLFMKLLSEQSRRSWFTIVALFVLGGLALAGGLTIFTNISGGFQETVVEIGQ